MQKARRHPLRGSDRCVSIWFQVLFTPLVGVLFIVQSPYWFTIGRQGVLRLGGWSPHVQAGFHGSDPTLGLTTHTLRDCHRLWSAFPDGSRDSSLYPRSLATTCGVAFCFPFLLLLRCFSSQGSLSYPIHSGRNGLTAGLPHSEIPGSQLGYQLLWAYRRFQRPSSPLDAKTSTICSY
jgi:hypothetical protein